MSEMQRPAFRIVTFTISRAIDKSAGALSIILHTFVSCLMDLAMYLFSMPNETRHNARLEVLKGGNVGFHGNYLPYNINLSLLSLHNAIVPNSCRPCCGSSGSTN